MKRFLLFSFSFLYSVFLWARSGENPAADTTKKRSYFELSFGSSLIFVSYDKSVKIRNSADIVIPSSAMLFFAEMRPAKKIRFPVFFNLPTESKQYVVNGQLVYVKASPTFGAGVQFNLFHAKLSSRTALEMELGAMGSCLFTGTGALRLAPIAAGRLRAIRDNDFVMYMGSSYSIGINAWGIFYGTGFFF